MRINKTFSYMNLHSEKNHRDIELWPTNLFSCFHIGTMPMTSKWHNIMEQSIKMVAPVSEYKKINYTLYKARENWW